MQLQDVGIPVLSEMKRQPSMNITITISLCFSRLIEFSTGKTLQSLWKDSLLIFFKALEMFEGKYIFFSYNKQFSAASKSMLSWADHFSINNFACLMCIFVYVWGFWVCLCNWKIRKARKKLKFGIWWSQECITPTGVSWFIAITCYV